MNLPNFTREETRWSLTLARMFWGVFFFANVESMNLHFCHYNFLSLTAEQSPRPPVRCAKARRRWRSRWSSARPGCAPTSVSRWRQQAFPCQPSTTRCSGKVCAMVCAPRIPINRVDAGCCHLLPFVVNGSNNDVVTLNSCWQKGLSTNTSEGLFSKVVAHFKCLFTSNSGHEA